MDIGSLVQRYPVAALALAGGAGYLVFKKFFAGDTNPSALAPHNVLVQSDQVPVAYVSAEVLQNALQAQREEFQQEIQREVQDRRWATQYSEVG